MFEDELTGLAEHLDFEAGAEDMELWAMRREAEGEARMEAQIHEMEEEERRAGHEAQQADPMRAVCEDACDFWGIPYGECRTTEDDAIPF